MTLEHSGAPSRLTRGGVWSAGLVAALVLLGLAPGSAHALDDPDTEIAKRHFAAGTEAYAAGDYARALREFEEARLAKPMPAFDYNIAKCLDRLERFDEAIAAYQQFARSAASSSDIVEVRDRIRTLRARSEARKALDARRAMEDRPAAEGAPVSLPAPSGPTARPAVPEPTARGAAPVYRKWWLWTGVGVVVAGAGIGLGVGLSRGAPSAPGCADCELGSLKF